MAIQDNEMLTTTVWDIPVRIGHWAITALFVVAYFTGEDEGLIFRVHLYTGYLILLIVLYRIAWGVIGGEHARFVNFIRPWADVKAHLESVLRLSPPACLGHNPTGGWMIILMLVTLILVVMTGMMAAVGESVSIPFFNGLPRYVAKAAEEVHEGAANVMMVMVGIHIIGVLVESLLSGENLIRSMINGRKYRPAGTPDSRRVGTWRAILLTVIVTALGAYLLVETQF